ncbi:VOC family protein [Paenibacillus lignilyticus]|uniref:VOC family protein n=1 Tax=Paenibacillus lignilyticus TaxID=1172615 RepID=A0ABS5CGG9_9BACL|nr:VOC family protein [Paenibacillus lignilyticus]MBP3964929.1 VOC family protein [Paenibacillus lignilyticus]
MTKLRPYLYCEDAKGQASFYVEALGGEIISQQTYGEMMPGAAEGDNDKVMHLVLQAAGLLFYMADAGPIQRGNGMDLTLEFETEEEAEDAFNNLSGNGGTVIMPFERMFWGSMFGRIEDKYGVRWQIATQPGH